MLVCPYSMVALVKDRAEAGCREWAPTARRRQLASAGLRANALAAWLAVTGTPPRLAVVAAPGPAGRLDCRDLISRRSPGPRSRTW